MVIYLASTNQGKLRDFAAAASVHGVEVRLLPGFESMPEAVEDADTFEGNARKKSEHYSSYAPGLMVVADDSGLAVDALGGAPGVNSARYSIGDDSAEGDTVDRRNNSKLLRELRDTPRGQRTAQFVCVISVAQDGREIATFRGTADGVVLDAERGSGGFGYDPLFFVPSMNKTFAELNGEEKSRVSHRGAAFRKLLEWAPAVRK